MEKLLIINKIKNDIECKICFEKFIKLTYTEFEIFYKDNEEFLPKTFYNDNFLRLYEDRFECIKCKNVVCEDCYCKFKNHKFKPYDNDIEDYEYFGELDENGLVEGRPGEDCPIVCPFCRTKDYKIFYGNKIPYELLNEIKNRHFK